MFKGSYVGTGTNLERLLDFWSKSGVNRLLATAHWDMDDQRRLDLMARFVSLAKGRGFEVLLYTGPFGTERLKTLSINPQLKEWRQINSSGKILSYGGLPFFCPNSPYLSKYKGPMIKRALVYCSFDGVFFDIPWFLKDACYCQFCHNKIAKNNETMNVLRQESIREALSRFVIDLRKTNPAIWLVVNADAPSTPYELNYTGADVGNLSGLFDEMVTEFSPARRQAKGCYIVDCIRNTRRRAPGTAISHATTIEDKNQLYPTKHILAILKTIIQERAGIWFSSNHFTPEKSDRLTSTLKLLSDSQGS